MVWMIILINVVYTGACKCCWCFSRHESLHWSKIMKFILFFFSLQINVDKFNVGRFLSHTNDGCPDGYMTISERDFTPMDGRWCGTAWGYNVYYSESSSINVSLKIYKLYQQQGLTDNFSFKLTYKFLKRTDAKLR